MHRLKLTLVLLLLNGVLLLALFYLEKQDDAAAAFEESDRLVIEPAVWDPLRALEIESSTTGQVWRLERGTALSDWELTRPMRWPVNAFAFNRLVRQLGALEWQARFSLAELKASQQELQDYGLADPLLTVTLQMEQGERSFHIGDGGRSGKRYYWHDLEDDTIYVLDARQLEALLQVDKLNSPYVFHLDLHAIDSLMVQDNANAGRRVRMVRDGERWAFQVPIQAKANREQVMQLLSELLQLEVESFLDSENLANAGQGLNSGMLRLSLASSQRQEELVIGREHPDRADFRVAKLANNPAAFLIPGRVVEMLRNLESALRERRLFDFAPQAIDSLEITAGTRGVSLQRLESGAWQVVYKNEQGELTTAPADAQVMQQLLQDLASLEAVQFATDAPSESSLREFALDDPQRVVHIRLKDGSSRRLQIGGLNAEDRLLYARQEGISTVYQLGLGVLYDLQPSPTYYRERTLFTMPEGYTLKRLVLRDRLTDTVLLERDLQGGRMLDATDLSREQLTALGELIRQSARFRVDELLPVPFAEPLQLGDGRRLDWRYEWLITLEPAAGNSGAPREQSFWLTERLGGNTQLGALPRNGVVFRFLPETVAAWEPFMPEQTLPTLAEAEEHKQAIASEAEASMESAAAEATTSVVESDIELDAAMPSLEQEDEDQTAPPPGE